MIETVQRHSADGEYTVVAQSTAAAYPARGRVNIEPAGLIPTLGRREMRIAFFGVGSAAQTGRALVVGWSRDRAGFTPIGLASTGAITLGVQAGSLGDIPSEAHLWAEQIASVTGVARLCSPGSAIPAALFVETCGLEWIEVLLMKTTATSLGALVSRE